MLLLLTVTCARYLVGSASEIYEWYLWWQNDRSPLVAEGVVERIHRFRGRNTGEQRLYIKSEVGIISLDSVLNADQLRKVEFVKEGLEFRYYLTPIGRRYVFEIRGAQSRSKYYEAHFYDEGWPGIAAALLWILMLMIMLFCIFGFLLLLRNPQKLKE